MKRSKAKLEEAIRTARSPKTKALAYYNLALFHDNNSREAEAIPNYEKAIRLGLGGSTKAEALAWLASSLYKTSQPQQALEKIKESHKLTKDKNLMKFLDGLEERVKKKHGLEKLIA